jgi:hypothetical protein
MADGLHKAQDGTTGTQDNTAGAIVPTPPTPFEQALAQVRTERARAFVQALVATWPVLDATKAARAAGAGKGAHLTGHRWRHREDVRHAVAVWIRERMEATTQLPADPEKLAEALLRQAWMIAHGNLAWFTKISADGRTLTYSLDHCTEAQLSVIESVEIKQAGRHTRIAKLRLKDSARALELLAKAAGLAGEWPAGARGLWPDATAKSPAPAGPARTVNIQVIYEQRDRRPMIQAELIEADPELRPALARGQ